jgi:exodeoxyribonuclease-3
MKLLSWNVNGIRAAANKGYSAWLSEYQPDILCIQETKANPDQLEDDLVKPNGYHSYWNAAEKKGYSGTATFTKSEPISIKLDLNDDKFDGEGRVIMTEFKEFILYNIYFPNGKRDLSRVDYKLEFSDKVLEKCEEQKKAGKKVIICGDFNTAHKEIDLKNAKSNEKNTGFLPEERAWIDKFISHGYIDTFRHFNSEPGHYTWWSYMFNARAKNVGWRIDYFFVTEDLIPNLKDAFILQEVMGSDHCPLGIELEF